MRIRHEEVRPQAPSYGDGAYTYRIAGDVLIENCCTMYAGASDDEQYGRGGAAMSKKKNANNDADLQQSLPGIESNLSQREQLAIISRIPAHEPHEELL